MRLGRPSPSLIVACIALILAGAGAAYAVSVPKKSVGPKQLRARAVKTAKLAEGAVTAPKLGATVTRVSPTASLIDGAEANAVAQCAAGERLVSGGGQVDEPAGPDTPIVASRPAVGTGGTEPADGAAAESWRVLAMNLAGGASGPTTVRAWAICLRG